MTILVSGASGIVGYGILRSLNKSSDNYKLIGTTMHDFSIAPVFCDIFEKALPTEHPDYMDWLCGIINKHSVDMIIPSIECDMYQWNIDRDALSLTGAFPLLNNGFLIDLCYDKWAFYERLSHDIPMYAIPTIIEPDFKAFPAPFLLKPRHGYGSKGIVRINNEREFEQHISRIGTELMVQPIIGSNDEEYTVSAFFDKESQQIDYFPLKRKLSKEGFTQEAEVCDRNFGEIIENLKGIFNPIGPTNFQFRFDGDMPKLLEINPRISSATSIRAALGYNESVMSVNYFLNNKIPVRKDKSGIMGKKAIRYSEDYIF